MYKVHINGVDYVAPDLPTLQQWVNEGRLLPDTFVWLESEQTHRKATEVPGLSLPGRQNYAAPPSMSQAPYTRHVSVPNNLILAIFATVCCCMPFGVAAIVFSAQVDGHAARGDLAKAQESAEKARNWAIASIGSWFVMVIGYFGLMAVTGGLR